MLQNLREETEWQERCAREAAWRLAESIFKIKEKNEADFFSPSKNWCLPAPYQVLNLRKENLLSTRERRCT